jgi:MarR family transcriptional regulator, temperature-dependent positive regulator of motility
MAPDIDDANDPITQAEDLARELRLKLDLLAGGKVLTGLSYEQYKFLAIINDKAPISVGQLGRLLGSAQSTTSEMVSRLSRHGMVTKVRSSHDGRVVKVETTDHGHQAVRRGRKRMHEAYKGVFAKLSPAEQEAFVGALSKLTGLLGKAEE